MVKRVGMKPQPNMTSSFPIADKEPGRLSKKTRFPLTDERGNDLFQKLISISGIINMQTEPGITDGVDCAIHYTTALNIL